MIQWEPFMNRLGLSSLWLLVLALLRMVGTSTLEAAATKPPPNLLFIFADDQSHETIHALGNEEIETPNLDRLVRSGTVFSHAYNMGAWHGAVCVASRTCLNTGRFVWRARDLEPNLKDEARAGRFWSQYLSAAGYETYLSGKWHVQANAAQIFDHTVHIRPGMPPDAPEGYQRPRANQPDVWKPWDKQFGGFWEGGRHWSEVLADDARNYLRQAAAQKRPFFMYLAFNAPHDPRQSPRESVDKYPVENIQVPENYLPQYPFMEAIGCGKDLRDERLAPWPRTERAIQVHRQEYFALISHTDRQIGKILASLETTGKAANTYVFYTADHGLAVGHHGLMGKQNMYEHSLRAPLIVVGPGIPAGRRIDTPVYLQDIMPTTLELAGVEIPSHVEYKSLLPLIRGERQRQYAAIYGAYQTNLQRMIRQDDFKLIHYPVIDKYLLFDLKRDPGEMNDLAGDPRQAGRLNALRKSLRELMTQMEDPMLAKSNSN